MIASSPRTAPNDPRQSARAAQPQPAAGPYAAPVRTQETFPAAAPVGSRSKISQATSMAKRLAGDYPVAAVLAAAALGAALGWFVKRRR